MAVQVLDVRVAPPPVPTHQLLLLVMREFDDMPTLRLTVPQGMRLWCLDRATCQSALNALVDSGLLQKDRAGRYARVKRCPIPDPGSPVPDPVS